jgi:hypothetical protein
MNIKKLISILILVSLTSCGFQPIYSLKNKISYELKGIELIGDKNINRKIVNIAGLKKSEDKEDLYELTLNSQKEINVVSKNKKSNVSIYRTIISVEVSLKDENKVIKTKKFSNSFTYNNNSNKFELSEYQKNIEKNLTDKIGEEIIIFLNY